MTAEFKFNADIGFTSSGLDKVLSDAKKGLNSLKGANLPINLTTKGGTPFNSSAVAKAVNLKGITDKLDIVNKKTKDVTSEFEKFGQTAAATVKRFGAFVIVANAFNSVSNAIQTSFNKAIEFEKQINKISQVTGTAYRDLGGLTAEISRLSIGLGVSSEKLANVALTLAQAGISAKDTKKALEVLAKTELSATFENINNTGEASIAIMAQFGTTVDDLSKQLSSINSISAKFAVESSDLATVIRRAGGAFQATGGDLEELLALFTSVRATTRESAESISTGLRTIFTRLQRTRTVNFLSELGIDLKDSKGQFIGVYQSIAVLSKALRDIKGSDPRFSQIVEELGGFRQVSKVIPLLKQFEMSEKALAVSRRANNSLDRDAIIAQQTLANKIQKTKEEFDALIRSYSESTFLKEATVFALGLASALIKVGDAIRPLIPAITLLSGVGFLKSINPISKGIASVFNPIRKKEGGIVPGSGNGDIVPAMLEPGEFVLKKSAVQAFGAHNLGKINRYAGGGVVGSSIVNRTNISKVLKSFFKDTGVNPKAVSRNIQIDNDVQGYGAFSPGAHYGTGIMPAYKHSPKIRLSPKNIKSHKELRNTLYHELGHGLDFAGTNYDYGTDSAVALFRSGDRGNPHANIAGTFLYTQADLLTKQNKKLMKSGKMLSKQYKSYKLSDEELFANSIMHNYTNPSRGKKITRFRETIADDIRAVMSEANTGHPFGKNPDTEQYSGMLPYGYLNIGKSKRIGKMKGFANGGIVGKITKAMARSRKQGLGSLLAGHQNLGPAPKFSDQLKDLLAPGGFLRSLGVGRKNWLMGDKGYTSVDNSPLVYQMSTRPYNRLLPPKQVIPPFPKQAGGPFVRFKTPGFVHPEGSVFPSPNSSPLPYVKPPFDITNENIGKTFRKFRQVESDYRGNSALVAQKLKVKKLLQEFKKTTGINPAGLVNTVGVLRKAELPEDRKGWAGSYSHRTRHISLVPENISRKNSYSAVRSLKGVLYHELGHAVDNGSFGKEYHSMVSDKSNQAKLADIYKAIYIKSRTKDLNSGKMGQKHFDYRGLKNEEFANFFSEYFRGTLKVPKSQQKKVNELVQSLLYAARGQARKQVEKSGRTLNDVLGLKKTIRKRYAGGGTVGGSGDTDTVPALLTPGEVVINKKSAQAFGYDKLHKINRYAKGGVVNKTNLAFAAATIGPSLAETAITAYSSEAGSALKPFVGAITVASAALLTFTFGLKENTADAEDSFKQYSEVLDKSSTRMTALEAQASKLKNTISAGTTPLFNTNGTGVPTPVLDAKGKQTFSKTLEAQKAEAKLTQNIIARNRLNPILAKTRGETAGLKSEIDTDKTFNKRALIGAIGAAVFAAAGSAVEGYAQRDAALGNKKSFAGIDTTTLSTFGGIAQGGANGLIAGTAASQMVGNPWAKGAIIAGSTAIGAITGGYTAGSTSAATLRQFESQKEIDSLLGSLAKVSSGRSTFTDQNPQILSGVDYINKQFTALSKDELPAFAAQLESALNGLDSLFNAGTESAKTLEEFKTRNEKLILAMSRFGGETIPQLEERAKNLIESQLKQNKVIEEATINAERLRAIFDISSAVEDAGRSISKLSSSLATLEDIINGQFGPSLSNLDFSALSNVGGSRISDVSEQASRAGSLIGGPAVQLGQDVTAAAQLSSKIPSILNEVINGNQLEEGDITDKLRAKFGKGFGADIFIEAINREIGATANSVELIKKFKQDPVGVAKTIQAAIDPMVSALSDATPKIIEQFDQFASGLASGRANFMASIDRFIKGIDIEQIGAELNANARGSSLSFEENQAFDARKLSSIAGPNNSVAQLNSRLINANENIRGLETKQSEAKTPEEFKTLTIALEENKKEAEVVHKSLEYLADVNNRLVSTQKELQRLQSERQNKAALAKSFAFGSPAEQRDILKGLMGVKTILANEKSGNTPLSNLSLESRKLALSIFEQYAGDKVFEGKTGQEKINSIAGAPFGIDFNKPTAAEEKVLGVQNGIIDNAQGANSALLSNLTSSNDKFIEGLGLRFDKFFVELRKSFSERAEAERKTKEEEKSADIANVGGKINFLKFIQKATGRNINDVNTVGAIRSNIAPLEKAKKLKEESEKLAEASKKFIKGGFKDGTYELESVLGKQFTRDFAGLKTPEQKRAFVEKESAAGIDKRFKERNQIFTEVNAALPGAVGGIYNNLKQLKDGLENINDGETEKGLLKKRKELEGKANGGVIGLATGGKVRGTDTVPAMTTDGKPYMLTPGEYVMKKSAVQKYGVGFMKKVNMGYLSEGGNAGGLTGLFQSVGMIRTPKKKQFYSDEHHVPSNKKYGDGIDASLLGKQYAAKKREEAAAERRLANKSGEELESNRLQEVLKQAGGEMIAKGPSRPFTTVSDIAKQVEKRWTPLSKNADMLAANNALTHIPVLPRRDTSFVDMMSAKRLEGERVKKNRNNISFGSDKFRPNEVALKRLQYQGAVKDNIAFGMSPEDAKRKAIGMFSQDGNQRGRFQREKNDLIRGGMSPKEASRKLLAEYKNDKERFAPPKSSGNGGGFFSVPPIKMNDTGFTDKASAARLEEERIRGNRNNLRLDDKQKIDMGRADFQKKRGELIRGGMSPREASQQLLHPNPPQLQSAQPPAPPAQVQAQPAQQAQMLNPQLIQEFNAAVNKLAGTKLEIVLNGTLDIRIIEGTLGDSLRDKFKEAAREYVDVKVTEAINTLAKDNGLAQVPKGINKGAQPK